MNDPFKDFPRGYFGAILADPPWAFKTWWSGRTSKLPSPKKKFSYPSRATIPHYEVMRTEQVAALPVGELAASNCVLFLWATWPTLEDAFWVIRAWGFKYKTCGFCWVKAHAGQIDMFRDDIDPHMKLGYWTRSNSEICLLAVKGKPKRRCNSVLQAIIEPTREHSRKPQCIYNRIERLVDGPRLELFARIERPGWTSWGLETTKFQQAAE